MKYANIYYPYGSIYGNVQDEMVNIGDVMQSLAIDNILNYMGIAGQDIVRIPRGSLPDYDGEYVILPINCMFSGFARDLDVFAFSDRIIPVFLGLAIRGDALSVKDIAYLKRYEPIGCRDEYTFEILKKHNILCWLNGCMTITFPKRKRGSFDKIICVDIPESIKEYLPSNYPIEFFTHIERRNEENMEPFVQERYEYYKKTAALIVTGRLHCAAPCIAAGIPTIVVKDVYETNFSWMERWTKLYTKTEFSIINWNVAGLEMEREKSTIIDHACMLLRNVFHKFQAMCDISQMYEEREKIQIKNQAMDKIRGFIDEKWNKEEEIHYAVWGFSMISKEIIQYISDNYRNAKLVALFDKYRLFEFEGIKSQKINHLDNYKGLKVLVMGTMACDDCRRNRMQKNIEEHEYMLCY